MAHSFVKQPGKLLKRINTELPYNLVILSGIYSRKMKTCSNKFSLISIHTSITANSYKVEKMWMSIS